MSRRDSGLTLIEVLVVVTILSMLVLSLYTVFKVGVDAWSKSEARLDIYQNARVVLDQMSRELPGAIVGGGALFVGTNGDPDTLEFVTYFADSLYMFEYHIDPADAVDILIRQYEENPSDYSSPAYTSIDFGFMINDIQFKYWDVASTDWIDEWDSSVLGDTLPEAVKVTLTLQDADDNPYPFETVIYLPNSE